MQLRTRVGAALVAAAGMAVLIGIAARSSGQISRTDGTALTFAGVPAVSVCGSGPTLSAGATDFAGVITVGSGVVTSCTLTFSATMANAPACVVTTNSVAVLGAVTTSTSALTAALSLTLGGGKIHYLCMGL